MKFELYQFKQADKAWYFTSARKSIEHAGITYKSIRGLQRGDIEDESIDKCDTDITLPQLNLINDQGDNLTQIFINKIYYSGVTVTILELEDGETLVLHKGRVTEPKFDEDADTITLVCSTAESYFNTNMLVRNFQKPCANNIYDFFCGLKIEDWAIEVTVTAVNGLGVSFTSSEPVDADWLKTGLLIKGAEHTVITSNTSNTVNLYRIHLGLKVGDAVLLAPGCDQSLKTCYGKFENNFRFNGHPNMPCENPLVVQLIK